jgi:hypothetical protein
VSRPWAGAQVIALDPGREKCGLAALNADGRLLYRTVTPTAQLPHHLAELLRDAPEATVLIGDGTSSQALQAALRAAIPGLALTVVPEAHSTERALERWRDTVPPRGWRRLLPRPLRFPSEPIDDFAAWLLADDHKDRGQAPTLK